MHPIGCCNPTPMEQQEGGGGLTKTAAVAACTAMAVLYVAILYAPTLILRLPPPNSFKSFMIRRFVCAAISSVVSLIVCSLILPWQALVFPLSLTSFMYAGSFTKKILSMLRASTDHLTSEENLSVVSIKSSFLKLIDWAVSISSNVSSWRNYFVAPLTEEIVFRACMIALLLCGRFTTYTVVFLCPIFFSLAHLNHLWELCTQQNYNLLRACTIVGYQLGYTVIFGAYASFLLVRTGHLAAPLVAHIFCNFMGLPVMFSRKSWIVTVAFVMGMLGFIYMLFPLTSPHLYNDGTETCRCWHRYCDWS